MTEEDMQALTIRLPRSLHQWLRRAAFDRKVPMNKIVTEAIQQIVTEAIREEKP
jgi:predicted HicB family RNase H-like nuclease